VEPTMQRCTAAAQMMRRPKARFAAAWSHSYVPPVESSGARCWRRCCERRTGPAPADHSHHTLPLP